MPHFLTGTTVPIEPIRHRGSGEPTEECQLRKLAKKKGLFARKSRRYADYPAPWYFAHGKRDIALGGFTTAQAFDFLESCDFSGAAQPMNHYQIESGNLQATLQADTPAAAWGLALALHPDADLGQLAAVRLIGSESPEDVWWFPTNQTRGPGSIARS